MIPSLQRTASVAALSLLLAFGNPALTAHAQTPATAGVADGTLLSVSATGEASRAPDVATASAGVVTQAADASAAMRANAAQMTRVRGPRRGVAERDIQPLASIIIRIPPLEKADPHLRYTPSTR